MKSLYLVLLVLALQIHSFAETPTSKVWAVGNVIYGQSSLGGSAMTNHTLTTKVRFVNARTQAATPWISKVTNNSLQNVNTISMMRPSTPDDYRLEVMYGVYCPAARFNMNDVSQTMLFRIGYSLNCLYLIPKTGSLITDPSGNKYYYGLYDLVPGCEPGCQVGRHMGLTTPFYKGKADANVQYRFWWVKVFWGSTYCLDAYEVNRNPCTAANCGDFTM